MGRRANKYSREVGLSVRRHWSTEKQKPWGGNPHLLKLHPMIVAQRRGMDFSIDEFSSYIEENIDEICEQLNSRWLISICDTFSFYDNARGARATVVATFANMVKFWTTDIWTRPPQCSKLLSKYRKRQQHICDGIVTITMGCGDADWNMIRKMDTQLGYDPVISKIWITLATTYEKEGNDRNAWGCMRKLLFKFSRGIMRKRRRAQIRTLDTQ